MPSRPNRATTSAKRLTTDPENDYAPAWSPDGTRIAYTSGRNEPGEQYSYIYPLNADGTGERDVTKTADQNEYDSTWSLDGKKIAFAGFTHPD